MNKRLKRFMSLLLTVVFVASMVFSAFAETEAFEAAGAEEVVAAEASEVIIEDTKQTMEKAAEVQEEELLRAESVIVTFDLNGHGTGSSFQQTVEAGQFVSWPDDPHDPEYIFRGWYSDKECRTRWKFDTDKPTGDITLYAGWVSIYTEGWVQTIDPVLGYRYQWYLGDGTFSRNDWHPDYGELFYVGDDGYLVTEGPVEYNGKTYNIDSSNNGRLILDSDDAVALYKEKVNATIESVTSVRWTDDFKAECVLPQDFPKWLQVKFYNDTTGDLLSSVRYSLTGNKVGDIWILDGLYTTENELTDGDYYFTAQLLGEGTDYYCSEVVKSELRHYTRPEAQLEVPTVIGWEKNEAGKVCLNIARPSGIESSRVKVKYYYSATAQEEPEDCRVSSMVPYNKDGIATVELPNSVISKFGDGLYYVKACSLPKNLTEVRKSEYTELSKGYDFKADTGKTVEDLEKIDPAGKSQAQIADEVQKTSAEELKKAMLANDKALEQIERLEQATGIKTIPEVKEEVKGLDASGISVKGAALNKLSNSTENIKLEVGKPAKEHVLPAQYNAAVSVQFSMDLTNVEDTENLKVPVMIDMPIPASINPSFFTILHYCVDDTMEIIDPYVYTGGDGKSYAQFVLTRFSDFVFTEEKEIERYTVTWENWDGTTLETDENVAFGATPTYDGATPTKPSDAQYSYTFAGWDKVIAAVTGDVTYTAVFTQTVRQYKVTFDVNGHGSSPAAITVSVGQKITKPADPSASSYTFGGWYKEAACTNEWKFDSDLMPGKDITLYAKWSIVVYTVKFDGNGATSGSMSAQSRKYDDNVALTSNAFKKTGYTFTGWNTNKDGSGKTYANKTTANIRTSAGTTTLYAQWKKATYTITYNLNSGKNSSKNPSTYTITSATITLENPTRTGYTFGGWYSDSKLTKKATTTIKKGSTGNKTFYAKWTANAYKIAFSANGGTGTAPKSISTAYGKTVTLTANPFKKTGYTFTGWNTKKDGSGTKYANKASVKNLTSTNGKTVTLHAQWSKTKYTITYNLNGGKNSTSNPASYTITSAEIKLANPNRTGYTFGGWYSDSKLTKKASTTIKKGSTGNKTFYAKWTANAYKIAFNANGGSGTVPKTISTAYGKTVTLTANSFKRTGYSFANWNTKKDGSGTKYANKASVKNLSSKSGATVTLYAQWNKTKYTITYNLNGGKNSTSNPSSYYVTTETITLKNPTRTGYTFGGWYSDSGYKTKVTSIKKGSTGNKTFYAKWTANAYTIAFNANGGIGTAPKTISTSYGKTVTLTANTFKRTGCNFIGWNTKADGSGTKYANKASVKNLTSKRGETVILYAQWEIDSPYNRLVNRLKQEPLVYEPYGSGSIIKYDEKTEQIFFFNHIDVGMSVLMYLTPDGKQYVEFDAQQERTSMSPYQWYGRGSIDRSTFNDNITEADQCVAFIVLETDGRLSSNNIKRLVVGELKAAMNQWDYMLSTSGTGVKFTDLGFTAYVNRY